MISETPKCSKVQHVVMLEFWNIRLCWKVIEWYLAHDIFSETGQVSNLQYKKTIKAETDADAFLGGASFDLDICPVWALWISGVSLNPNDVVLWQKTKWCQWNI